LLIRLWRVINPQPLRHPGAVTTRKIERT
jgi:hypothetical protein